MYHKRDDKIVYFFIFTPLRKSLTSIHAVYITTNGHIWIRIIYLYFHHYKFRHSCRHAYNVNSFNSPIKVHVHVHKFIISSVHFHCMIIYAAEIGTQSISIDTKLYILIHSKLKGKIRINIYDNVSR